jgi:hypothetical protein
LKNQVADGKNEKVSASAGLFILLLVQNALLGMDTISTPWIANHSVEFVSKAEFKARLAEIQTANVK